MTRMILIDSDEAAKRVTMGGWMSSNGMFCLDERTARWAGCTHVKCKCGVIIPKNRTICETCFDKDQAKEYAQLPKAPWDGKCMLYSQVAEVFYASPDDAKMDMDDNQSLADLRLVLCKPVYAQPLDADYYYDDLCEDAGLPTWLADAIDAFNAMLAGKPPLSWETSNVALDIEATERSASAGTGPVGAGADSPAGLPCPAGQ